ncbi:Zinc finger RING-type protein [Botryosphaeria dothidea]|uniref:Zinc finger RING-type protein n=1 Tax=Botryosphaeria dothidea TaxID=55169 RepID=A0A8H4N9D8_9PEZI|nr:Zinc finger RING-type protein [Botryosphaeria dothidea]
MSARPLAHNSSPDHQQSAALPPPQPSWSWDAIPSSSPSLPGRHEAIQQLTLPPMHMQQDPDSDLDPANNAPQPEQSASRSSFLAHILNSGEDMPGTRRPAATSSSRPPNPPYTLSRPAHPPPTHSSDSSTQHDPRLHASHGYVDLTREQSPPISQERSTLRTLHHNLPSAVESPRNTNSVPSPFEPASLSSSPMAPTRRRKRESTSPLFVPLSPSPKRAKRNDDSSSGRRGSRQGATGGPSNAAAEVEEIERIDLLNDDTPLAEALQKQRAEQVKAQQESQNGADALPRLTTITCVICMDTFKDLTATACGHLFCHECLMEALIAGEARAGPGEPKRSQCPVCRKALSRNKTGDIIPILMKQALATQPRRQKATTTTAPA